MDGWMDGRTDGWVDGWMHQATLSEWVDWSARDFHTLPTRNGHLHACPSAASTQIHKDGKSCFPAAPPPTAFSAPATASAIPHAHGHLPHTCVNGAMSMYTVTVPSVLMGSELCAPTPRLPTLLSHTCVNDAMSTYTVTASRALTASCCGGGAAPPAPPPPKAFRQSKRLTSGARLPKSTGSS
eukprot:356825-Chlamydomonas_euryale.AAC.2